MKTMNFDLIINKFKDIKPMLKIKGLVSQYIL